MRLRLSGKLLLFVVLSAALCCSCGRKLLAPLGTPPVVPVEGLSGDNEDVVAGWIRVKLRWGVALPNVGLFCRGAVDSGSASIDRLALRLGTTEIRRVFAEGGKFAERRREYGMELWYDLNLSEEITVAEAIEEASLIAEIEVVQPIYKINLQ